MSEPRPEYAYHQPDADQLEKMTRLRQAFSDLQTLIDECCPPSRYTSLAGTTLETSAFWANKAVVLGEKGNRAR